MIVGRKSRFFVIKDSPRRLIISNKKRSERNIDFYSEKRQKHFMWLRDNTQSIILLQASHLQSQEKRWRSWGLNPHLAVGGNSPDCSNPPAFPWRTLMAPPHQKKQTVHYHSHNGPHTSLRSWSLEDLISTAPPCSYPPWNPQKNLLYQQVMMLQFPPSDTWKGLVSWMDLQALQA